MIDTKELAEACKVSLKSITEWAKKNDVQKSGYRWNFTPSDCRKLFDYYKVDVNELPLNLKNELFTENEDKIPINEANNESNEVNYEDFSTYSKLNEANELILESYREQIKTLQEQVKIKDEQLAKQADQISELISSNNALAASNAVHVASDKKEVLLAEPKKDDEIQEAEQKGFWQRLFGF